MLELEMSNKTTDVFMGSPRAKEGMIRSIPVVEEGSGLIKRLSDGDTEAKFVP